MSKLVIKNAKSGNRHSIVKFVKEGEEGKALQEYVVLDLLTSESPKAILDNWQEFNGVTDTEIITPTHKFVKFHVDWKSEENLYNDEGDLVETREKTTTAYYLLIVEL